MLTTSWKLFERLRSMLCIAAVLLLAALALSNHFASATPQSPGRASSPVAPAFSLRYITFKDHLYAVADVNLESQEIIFSTAVDNKPETYPVVISKLYSAGLKPVLITNGGIYGIDSQPLGLLITPGGKKHDVNIKAGSGNFSWDSAVFQILDGGAASIVPARDWQDNPHTIAATQSGPQLASSSKINQGFQPQSRFSFRRTAAGVDRSNKRIVHLVVTRDSVTLFELATFMVDELHCSEALHLDGDLSAFYIPSSPDKFVFSDPGERIVTALSVIEKVKPGNRALKARHSGKR